MGEMADMALDACVVHEALLDEYVSGGMGLDEAYDHGIIDESGCERSGVQGAWDRCNVETLDDINDRLKLASLELDYATEVSTPPEKVTPVKGLSANAIRNLSKPCPSCNCCGEMMEARSGRYGKFYFCTNACEGQKTVSDAYWQKVKR